jgi:hypothetical protein
MPHAASHVARIWAFGAILVLISTGALAQADEKATSDSRFIYQEVDEGILRLDSRTGEVSLCNRQDIGWACRLVADESRAVDGEVGRLERENAKLRQLLADKDAGGAAPAAQAPATTGAISPSPRPEAAAPPAVAEKPTENAPGTKLGAGVLNRSFAAVDTIWRRLVEMMANVKSDLQKSKT